MSDGEPYTLSLTPAAQRAMAERLRLGAATAVAAFLNGALLAEPWRVGKPLRWQLGGYHAARRGVYRVVYRIDEPARTVHVIRIDHRRDAYGR